MNAWLKAVALLGSLGFADVASAQTKIPIPTVTPNLSSALIQHTAPAATVSGELYLPKGNGPFPAMVLKHGSGGLGGINGDNIRKWAATFAGWGIAAFIVDSFGPRGIKETATDQGQLSSWADIADSLAALKVLAADPRIDKSRIGIIGWSRGGTPVLATALETVRKAVIEDDVKFAVHISVYGPAITQYRDTATDKSPFLFLHGEADDYVPIAATREFSEWLKTMGNPVSFIGYPKASHDFDVGGMPFALNKAVEVAGKCDLVVDIPTNKIIRMGQKPATGVTGEAMWAYFKTCTTKGAHLGYDAAARADAVEKVRSFLKEQFKISG